ncbi:MAG: response regulator transcription factor [Anaerolineae bacterium]|nr:response regulator transcription factor [Anaerolineae bacterium]
MSTLNALVVDDEAGIRYFVQETLRRDGHTVTTAASGDEALHLLRDTCFDLIVLDLMLGGRVDGLRVLEAVRWRWPQTMVIILTAHGSLESALAAISEGIDGYLLKPVEPAELRQAMQEALERRQALVDASGQNPAPLECGPLTIDVERRIVSYQGKTINLSAAEFTLLVYLAQNARRAVDAVELVQAVRGYRPRDVREAGEIIKWYIHSLRNKLEPDPAHPRHILTVRGAGYRLNT